MRMKFAGLCLGLLLGAGLFATPTPPAGPHQVDYSAVYCSGFVSDQKVPTETYLISGEQSDSKLTFTEGDYVYLNRGADNGVKVGDEYSVLRSVSDPLEVPWFQWQEKLIKAMGTMYEDEGRVKVVKVHPKVSIARIAFSCAYMQRGDIVRPFAERPMPPYKDPGAFDHFAPPSGKPVATLVTMAYFAESGGQNSTVYVNLGAAHGVKVGDYVRFFRQQGTRAEAVYKEPDYQFKTFGFGSTPARYSWNDLPREVLGEGVVINASKNSATVFVTFSSITLYVGDKVELE